MKKKNLPQKVSVFGLKYEDLQDEKIDKDTITKEENKSVFKQKSFMKKESVRRGSNLRIIPSSNKSISDSIKKALIRKVDNNKISDILDKIDNDYKHKNNSKLKKQISSSSFDSLKSPTSSDINKNKLESKDSKDNECNNEDFNIKAKKKGFLNKKNGFFCCF